MPLIEADGLELYVESVGNPEDPALLLIPGMTAQLISYSDEFDEALVDRGFFVIRMENRDVGLSTKFPDGPQYSLSDMANDSLAVLAHFGVDKAHVFGISMGAMIAQVMAIEHPEAVISLISYASSTGNPDFGAATDEALAALLLPEAKTRDEIVANSLAGKEVWGTPDSWSVEERSAHFAECWDRARSPGNGERQMMAVFASGNREDDLAKLQTPTLVIHGSLDPLITKSGGERTAEIIPGATYVEIEGMGHDIPITELPHIVQLITNHAAQAGGA